MKTIVGYKFQSIHDNGDTCEWYREIHLESPIYTTEYAARNAITLVKNKMIRNVRINMEKYISIQIMFEIKHGRSVNKFLSECQQCKMRRYKDVLVRMREVEVVPIYGLDCETDEFKEYSIA